MQSTWPRTDHPGGVGDQWRYALVVVQAGDDDNNDLVYDFVINNNIAVAY